MNTQSTNKGIHTGTIGARIREERKRLRLSQEAFAKEVGVHRRTQINYESGERNPDTAYLAALAAARVDVGYVLTGQSASIERQAYAHFMAVVQEALELVPYDAEMQAAFAQVAEDTRAFWEGDENAGPKGDAAVHALLKKSPVLMLDARQLEDLIEKLEFVIESKGVAISASDKARAILHLFREIKKPGAQLDFKAVEAAILSWR